MDAISAAGLVALASGAGGAAGTQLWAGLVALVSRSNGAGASELEELERAPENGTAAEALAGVLMTRADGDPQFARELHAWEAERERLLAGSEGSVNNTVSGGRQGNVLQAREIHGGVSFGAPPAPERRDAE
ncbi:hypothetical protein ACFVVB_02705 [Streptomyces californicus]|uniref:hypothetical protein n=1 Tax=Streptomyces californicus TaxID=67351 RepID=UPI0036D9940F